MTSVSDLIDTTEMYLRTIYELVEEDIVPLRARIAERLHQSGPTVSQTVARMERDGLLTVEGDRHLELTEEGQLLATRVMRKHRLAERLLTDVIGLDWELVHAEACRWEHVMSETVERRLLELLDHPTESPYGNPIPGLDELGEDGGGEDFMDNVEPLSDAATSAEALVHVKRISEEMQKDEELMGLLRRVGALPGRTVTIAKTDDGILIGSGGETAELVARGGRAHLRAPLSRGQSAAESPDIRGLSRFAPDASGAHRETRVQSSVRNSLHPTSSLYDASASPRVSPRLTITIGVPRTAARLTNRRPLMTVSDDPATSSAPSSPSASTAS